ncbi:MAG: primosomal protein N' [Alphaproteobacteria bacterium]|nr:primosomal protein N' [Alphaproteobacteria bacterium]
MNGIEKKKKNKYFMFMFNAGDIVKILVPNAVNTGYDYRLSGAAELGSYVAVTIMGRPYIGVVYGLPDGAVAPEKIKSTGPVFPIKMPVTDLQWIQRMSAWTLMPPGAVLRLIINVPDAFAPPRVEALYTYDTAANIRMTDSRQAVADAFEANEFSPMSVSDIQNISHASRAVINAMIKSGALVPADERPVTTDTFVHQYHDTGTVVLNNEQQSAADTIAKAIERGGFSVYLLDGITGSGKTQVYFDAAWRAYNAGHSVLLMMPEIALTAQFMERFSRRFGAPPVVWHSNLTAAARREIWRGVARGDIRMVVGTRSALFLPWQKLGLIVVDEEHDTSYKQEDMGNYHARDMAVLRAKIAGFPVILASATPSAETLNNAATGRYQHLRLTSRFGGASLPSISTIDLRDQRPMPYRTTDSDDASDEIQGNLTPSLCDAIGETLNAGQQTLLFINRRGFAPIVQCKKCGFVAQCPDCSVSMTYHKRMGKLLCHMCGRTSPMPQTCPNCGGPISTRGAGMEKIEAEVSAKFPGARTACVSSDTIMSRAALQRLVQKMESGEIDIVIGTQILAKGHHFPNLTLVGVVDADMGLFGTDFRAGEHTFQQLFQVAGRAGRGDAPGRVLMQTYQPDHPVLRAICECNREAFMDTDMAGRRAAKMPPFGQLIALIIEGQKESVLQRFCADLAAAAPSLDGGRIMGPVPAQIYQIRNWYRMRFLISGDARANLQPVVAHWIAKVKVPANIRVKIDVGPQNFM